MKTKLNQKQLTERISSMTANQVRELLDSGAVEITSALIQALVSDPRASVRKLGEKLQARGTRMRRESKRMAALLALERELWSRGLRAVAGVDEVGAGPLAGPVVAGAVIFDPQTRINGIDDSKKLDGARRERLEVEIRARALAVGIGIVEPDEIDRINIYRAALKAMKIAVDNLGIKPDHILVDARTIPDLIIPQTPIIKGDAKVHAIAAASVVAKVFRDRIMCRYAEEFPGYGFELHKGYATEEHIEAIRRLGPCPIHRMSFSPLKQDSPDQLDLGF